MLNAILFGLLLGWGAAIPIGPINLEVIRRHLHLGMAYGIALGLGACLADLTYLILLSLGALAILTQPLILKIVGIAGSLILAWFGYSALRAKASVSDKIKTNTRPVWAHTLEGYSLTMLNPMTILFWTSVSAQIATFAQHTQYTLIYAGAGVFLGTLSWILALNTVLFFTRHRLSARAIEFLNISGGVILLGFAVMGLWRAVMPSPIPSP